MGGVPVGGGPVTVVIGDDAGEVGALVVDLEARGVRAAAFVGDPSTEREALVEMLVELFPARPGAGAPEPP